MKITPDGTRVWLTRELAEEVPVALEFNGVGYAVLMASPLDLEDLLAGFVVSERLQTRDDEVPDVTLHQQEQGIVVRANLAPDRALALLDRVRHRASDTSCGLCGLENIEQAMRPLPRVTAKSHASEGAVFQALGALQSHQNLNERTGSVHAAALVDANGAIRLVREDVGRHNALDKLIGAMRRAGADWDGGFALLSSRCSYDLVEKAVLANCPLLVTISAPTRLAIDRASDARLDLRILARSDSVLAVTEPPR